MTTLDKIIDEIMNETMHLLSKPREDRIREYIRLYLEKTNVDKSKK